MTESSIIWGHLGFRRLLKTSFGENPDLSFLAGKGIVAVGFLDQEPLMRDDQTEGGLAIDYEEDETVRRVVLGFTELGMWIQWRGEVCETSAEDLLRAKVRSVLGHCELKIATGGRIEIHDGPAKNCFWFVDEYELLCLALSLEELGSTTKEIRDLFASPEKDVEKILTTLKVWSRNGEN